jgi:DNA-binding response OmpR family regulator
MSEETHLLVIEEKDESTMNITLMNLAIEGNDGAALRDLIKNDPSAVVVVLIPEHMTDPDNIVQSVREGDKAYIKKPASGEDMRRRLTKILRRSEAK